VSRPPLPPFTQETAAQKARMAEDAWNTRDPARVALAYTENSRWRNRAEFLSGRPAIEAFLTRKWNRELDYREAGSAATAMRTGSSTRKA
jgi:nuclear transport factor 2 (NTF2) superfamily protein